MNDWLRKHWWLPLMLVVMLVIPNVIPIFYVHVLVEALCLSILAMSFNFLFGYMGMLSFGQAAYYGVGAYTVSMLITKTAVPFGLSIIASIVVAAAVGAIVGAFCVRMRGIYFGLLTMGFGQLLYVVCMRAYSFTGGDDGIQAVFPPAALHGPYAYYYFVLVMFAASAVIYWYIVHSPFGHTMKSMRENPRRLQFLGVNLYKYYLIAFIIAAALAGLGGALWAPFNRSVHPSMMDWAASGQAVVMGILGGPLSFWGPILGAFMVTFIHAIVTGFTTYWMWILGLVLLLVVLFLPGGIIPSIAKYILIRQETKAIKLKEASGSGTS